MIRSSEPRLPKSPAFSTPSVRRLYQVGKDMQAAAEALPWYHWLRKRQLAKQGEALSRAAAVAGATLPPDPRTWRQERLRAEIERFEQAIEYAKRDGPGDVDPRIHQAMIEGLESQLADLRASGEHQEQGGSRS